MRNILDGFDLFSFPLGCRDQAFLMPIIRAKWPPLFLEWEQQNAVLPILLKTQRCFSLCGCKTMAWTMNLILIVHPILDLFCVFHFSLLLCSWTTLPGIIILRYSCHFRCEAARFITICRNIPPKLHFNGKFGATEAFYHQDICVNDQVLTSKSQASPFPSGMTCNFLMA